LGYKKQIITILPYFASGPDGKKFRSKKSQSLALKRQGKMQTLEFFRLQTRQEVLALYPRFSLVGTEEVQLAAAPGRMVTCPELCYNAFWEAGL